MSNIIKYDFQGHLYSFNLDGWFNATEAAARFGKRPGDWLNDEKTVSYLVALAEALGLPGHCQGRKQLNEINELKKDSAAAKAKILRLSKSLGLVRTRSGAPSSGGGTWMHPKVGVAFARWLSVEFGVWCDLQIDSIIRNGIRAEGRENLLPLFLRESAAEWELRFQPSYYHALARMSGTHYAGHAGGTPTLYGHVTDQWVYGCILPDDVYAELKARREKSQKMHQWMTDGGQEILDRQIALVTAIAASSADYQDFKARMMAVSNRGGQLGFVYPRAA